MFVTIKLHSNPGLEITSLRTIERIISIREEQRNELILYPSLLNQLLGVNKLDSRIHCLEFY